MKNNELEEWLKLSDETKNNIFSETANSFGLPSAALEKDWCDILSQSENDFRNNQLQVQLKEDGFIFHSGIGISKNEDWSEDSFFIENIDLENANAISLKYGQLAFLYGDWINGNQLIFTKNK
jgi:hypothetical protein